MTLTRRRREFLDHIYRLYKKNNLPVHYSRLAEDIGVSKWTAYDVLKGLENQGFVKRTYSTNSNETGRSVVVFTPTKLAEDFFQKERRELSNLDEWQVIFHRATEYIVSQHNIPLSDAIKNIVTHMKDVDVKLELCTYFLSLLILYLNSLGKKVKDLTVNMLNASADSKIQLTLFVGAVVGMIIQSVSKELSPDMIKLVQQFFNNANQLNTDELNLLVTFINHHE